VRASAIVDDPVPSIIDTDTDAASTRPTPWQRLRNGFVMPGCDYQPSVLREAGRYSRSAERFASNWRTAMPFLLLVLDEIERRKLPTEFALLPYVESHFRPLAANGRGPAGLWQLMPRTATAQGLVLNRKLDERLDAVASTGVALDLLERYDREFGDWRLATMAYNAGEFRIKAQLGGALGTPLSAEGLAQLNLSPTTHQHLARLLALACIIREPDRFQVSLPAVGEDDTLEFLAMPTSIDLRLAASLSGLSPEQLRLYNAAFDPTSSNAVLGTRILLPKSHLARFEAGLRDIPEQRRAYWKSKRVEHAGTLAELADQMNISSAALAAANRQPVHADLQPGQTLLVPSDDPIPTTADNAGFHRVRSGDTLSTIARRHGISLGQLLHWNSIRRNSILRIGLRLQIRAPGY
jgi:membrane-bound lytic murein transglycosylase D